MTFLKRTKIAGVVLATSAAALMSYNASADFVILDDLIVDGSACVGFDCVNGEVFGFDTIKLKENNLRIKFEDTSTAASFPTTDWQLTANASANGGASKFSIDDISGGTTPFTVEANARTNALYVDDGGRIGAGTGTPSVIMHLKEGDTPTVRLDQDGTSGFAPQIWDVAGNETNFFIRDSTNGSTLPFRIRPGADSNALFVDDTNDIGMGTASPVRSLHVTRDDTAAVYVENSAEVTIDRRAMFWGTNWGGAQLVLQDRSEGKQWKATGGAQFVISDQNAVDKFILDPSGDLTVTGSLFSSGGTCGGGCDKVFDADYDLPTIEDHASEMFANRYLPNVGPTPENAPINVSDKLGRMLNELEKAHIYIADLNEQNKALLSRIEKLEAQDSSE